MILFHIATDNIEISTRGAPPLKVPETKENEKHPHVSYSLLDCLLILCDGEVRLCNVENAHVGQSFFVLLFRFELNSHQSFFEEPGTLYG